MVGAAVKGLSKILRKTGKVKRPRGTPTKAGMMARKNMLKGAPKAGAYDRKMPVPKGVKAPKKKPLIGKTEKGIGIGVAGTLAYQEIKKGKKSEAKTKDKLKKSIEKHKEKDKRKKEKKHHSR